MFSAESELLIQLVNLDRALPAFRRGVVLLYDGAHEKINVRLRIVVRKK